MLNCLLSLLLCVCSYSLLVIAEDNGSDEKQTEENEQTIVSEDDETENVVDDSTIVLESNVVSDDYSAFIEEGDSDKSETRYYEELIYNDAAIEDITFELESDEKSYYVKKYTGYAEDVTIPENYNGLPVTRIGSNAFSYTNIKTISIPSTITAIGMSAFNSCKYLSEVKLPASIEIIEQGAFDYCSSLTEIIIPGSVKTIGMLCFGNCDELKTVIIEEGVEKIGNSAFEYCNKLSKVLVPSTVTEFGILIFTGCSLLRTAGPINSGANIEINYSEEIKEIHGLLDPVEKVELSDNVTSVGSNAFNGCKNLKEVILPDHLVTIGQYAFTGCIGLTNINFPETLKTIDNCAFRGCQNLRNIRVPVGVGAIGSLAFADCSLLKTIILPEEITTIQSSAFENCTELISIAIPGKVTTIVFSAFNGCKKLAKIYLPNSVTSIQMSAFNNCEALSTGDVYYTGTETQFNRINIGAMNDPFRNASKHFEFSGKILHLNLFSNSEAPFQLGLYPNDASRTQIKEDITGDKSLAVKCYSTDKGIKTEDVLFLTEFETEDIQSGNYIIASIKDGYVLTVDSIDIRSGETALNQIVREYGDVNGDGAVDVVDLSLSSSYILAGSVIEDEATDAADYNQDGVIDVGDLSLISSRILSGN